MTTAFLYNFRNTFGMVLLNFVTALVPATVKAQDWSGQITAYGWGAGVTGDFTPIPGGPTLSFDASLSEVLEDLDGAFFLSGLARRENLVLFGDLTYSRSSRAGIVPPGIPASGEVTIRSLTVAAGRRLDGGNGTTVDVLGGVRAWDIDGAVAIPLAGVSRSPSQSFVDPIVAMRVNAPLSDRWSVIGYVDLGGFGVGSDFTWQAAVTANYQMRGAAYLSIGWRHLSVDYSDEGTAFEGAMTGPLLGLTLQF